MGLGELLGFLSGLACVWLAGRGNILNFPVGLLNSALLLLLFWDARLFADASLQILFIGLGLQGWWRWARAKRTVEGPVRWLSRRGRWLSLIAAAALIGLLVPLLTLARGSLPLFDASITGLSVVAQVLLNLRRAESWLYWIAVDAVSVPVYASKGLWLIALLYLVFLGMAVGGARAWRREADGANPAPTGGQGRGLAWAGGFRQTLGEAQMAQVWRAREGAGEGAGEVVLALAEAGEAAFELPRYCVASGRVLDALTREGSEPWPDAHAALVARRDELGPDLETSVYASAVRARIAAEGVRLSWVGGCRAVLVRDGRVLARTAPHTLGNRFRRERGLDAQVPPPMDQILVRSLDPNAPSDEPEEERWELRPGDRLILLSGLLEHRRDDARILAAAAETDPARIVSALLEPGPGEEPPVGLGAVAVVVGGGA